jgi:hypothetical protein
MFEVPEHYPFARQFSWIRRAEARQNKEKTVPPCENVYMIHSERLPWLVLRPNIRTIQVKKLAGRSTKIFAAISAAFVLFNTLSAFAERSSILLTPEIGGTLAAVAEPKPPQPFPVAPAPRPSFSQDLRECIAQIDHFVYCGFLGDSSGKTESGERICRVITEDRKVECSGADCWSYLDSVSNLDFYGENASGVGVCDATFEFELSQCEKRAGLSLPRKDGRCSERVPERIRCYLQREDCLQVFRVLACKYNATDRLEYLDVTDQNGKLDQRRCSEVLAGL